MIPPRWELQPCNEAEAATLAAALKIAPALARLLCLRGLTDPDLASQMAQLSDNLRALRPGLGRGGPVDMRPGGESLG